MDAELLELARQFESAQQAKSSIRLSERNVVELVQKLHELHIIDFDLLHTVSGKEYITPEQLRHEMVLEIKKLGRVSLIDLADITGVDLYHVENQAQRVVSDDPSGLMLIQGEIISQSYWDSVAEEINERLQECSQISLAEIAANLNVGSELVASMLEARLGTLVKGRLEGGQLYTPAYVTRVSAMVRGAARGVTVPTNLSFLWGTLQQLLQAMDGAGGVATESSFFQSLFNGLAKEGEILGSLRAGVHWTPTVFATAQRECVDSFFSQNSFISYDTLQKLGISQPVQFLQSRYAEGIPLVTAFAHPSMIEMLDAAVEDAIDRSSWIDSLSVLPTSFGSQDASKILSHCNSVQSALKGNKGMILGDSYVFSNGFIKDVYGRMEKELEVFRLSGSSGVILSDDFHLVMEAKTRTDSGRSGEVNEKKKKKGKSSGARTEILIDDEEIIPLKSKKNQRKGKEASLVLSDTKKGTKKDLARTQEDDLNIPSDDWIMQKILTLVPDFEEQGLEDPQTILGPLANYMRPMLISSLKEKRKTLFSENSGKMKHLLDNLQKKLDEAFLNMQLYEKALDLFEDDQSTSAVLHRHLLRTMAASIGGISDLSSPKPLFCTNMARYVIFSMAIFLAFCMLSCKAQQQPCAAYKFSNNKQFSSCIDLPVLSSSLHWNYHPSSNRVDVAFRHTGVTDRRWIAWAINPTSGGMIRSQAIVSFPRTDGGLAVYTSPITSYGTRLEQGNLSFPVLDLSASNQNNEMIIYASLELHGNISTVNHLWQVGPMSENTPMMHSVAPSSPNVKSMGSLDFLSGRITTTRSSSSTLRNIHGILNTVSWGILMPIGAVIARYLKRFEAADPLWFYLHVSCQLLAYILGGLAGFGSGIFLGARSHGIEHSSHKIIGIVLFCLATAQVFGGLVRPDKDSKYRPFFNWFHLLAGCSTLILGIFNIYKGFDILHAAKFWRLAYSGVILTLLLATLLLEIYTRWCMPVAKRSMSDTVDNNTSTVVAVAAMEV